MLASALAASREALASDHRPQLPPLAQNQLLKRGEKSGAGVTSVYSYMYIYP